MANVQDITLSVPDVSCGHCIKTVDGTLGTLAGVEAASTDLASKSVRVRYDASQVSLEQIKEALDDVGYTVSEEPAATPRTSGKPLNLL